MGSSNDKQHPEAPAVALLLGPGNSLAQVGANWRWVRDTARELGVPLVGFGRKQFVPAGAFVAALERNRGRGVSP